MPMVLIRFNWHIDNLIRLWLVFVWHLVFTDSPPEAVVLITPCAVVRTDEFDQLVLTVPLVIGADGAEAGLGFRFGFQPAQLVEWYNIVVINDKRSFLVEKIG